MEGIKRMGEVGCLKDGHFQNLEVGGTGMLLQKSDIVNTSGVLLNTSLPKTSIFDFTPRAEFLEDFSMTLGTETVTGDTVSDGKYSTGKTTFVATVQDAGTDGAASQTIVSGGAGNNVFPSGGNRCTAFVTDDANDDSIELQSVGDPFTVTDDTEFYMETRLKVNDVTTTDLMIGLGIIDTTFHVDGSDGIYFEVSAGAGTVTLVIRKNGTEQASATIHTLENDTFVTLGFYKSGNTNNMHKIFVNGTDSGVSMPDFGDLPDDLEIFPTIVFQNGSAAASTLTMDYLYILNR